MNGYVLGLPTVAAPAVLPNTGDSPLVAGLTMLTTVIGGAILTSAVVRSITKRYYGV